MPPYPNRYLQDAPGRDDVDEKVRQAHHKTLGELETYISERESEYEKKHHHHHHHSGRASKSSTSSSSRSSAHHPHHHRGAHHHHRSEDSRSHATSTTTDDLEMQSTTTDPQGSRVISKTTRVYHDDGRTSHQKTALPTVPEKEKIPWIRQRKNQCILLLVLVAIGLIVGLSIALTDSDSPDKNLCQKATGPLPIPSITPGSASEVENAILPNCHATDTCAAEEAVAYTCYPSREACEICLLQGYETFQLELESISKVSRNCEEAEAKICDVIKSCESTCGSCHEEFSDLFNCYWRTFAPAVTGTCGGLPCLPSPIGKWYTVIGTDVLMEASVCHADSAFNVSVFTGGCKNLQCVPFRDHKLVGDCGKGVFWWADLGVLYNVLVHGRWAGDFDLHLFKVEDVE